MWVTTSQVVEALKPSSTLGLLSGFTHNFSHKLKGLNSPLTWGYSGFPQLSGLVTTTTYNSMKTPVRFPFVNFQSIQLLKTKNLQSFTTAGRLTK
jgi:hypothetical protein